MTDLERPADLLRRAYELREFVAAGMAWETGGDHLIREATRLEARARELAATAEKMRP